MLSYLLQPIIAL
jgi:hypothetical protein